MLRYLLYIGNEIETSKFWGNSYSSCITLEHTHFLTLSNRF